MLFSGGNGGASQTAGGKHLLISFDDAGAFAIDRFAEDAAVFESVKPKIAAALAESAQSGVRDNHALSQVVRRTIGRWVNQSLRRRPMIVPLVIEA